MFKRYSNQLWYLNRHVQAYVKMDELAKIDRNADRLEIEIEKGNSLDHHRVARDKKKAFANRKCVKTTRVCMDDGHPANSVVTEKLIFREHFGAKLAGTVLPFKALLDKDRVDSSNVFCEVNCAVGDSRMPSRMQRAVPFLCSFQQRCVWGKQPPKLHCSPFPTFLCPPLFLPCSQVLLSCCPTPPCNGEVEFFMNCSKTKAPPWIANVTEISCWVTFLVSVSPNIFAPVFSLLPN